VATEAGANLRTGETEAGANTRSAAEIASQQLIAKQNAAIRKQELDTEVEKMGIMFGFKKDEVTTKGMQDIVKGAQPQEDAVTGTNDAIKVLQLAKTNPSLGSAAKLRSYMAANGMNSAQLRAQIVGIADENLDPSAKGRLADFVSGVTEGVPVGAQLDAGIKALQQVRGAAFQSYHQKLMAGAVQHTEVPDAMQRIGARESLIAPDLAQGAASSTAALAPASHTAGTGGNAGSLRSVTPGEWSQIQQSHGLTDAQMAKYYQKGGQ
jgi:hypothetical protein